MSLTDDERRQVLGLLERIRLIVRGPVGAEPPMAGDVVGVAVDEPDTDGGLAKQAAETASRGIYAGTWCPHGRDCPHPNVCKLNSAGCTDRRDVFHHPV